LADGAAASDRMQASAEAASEHFFQNFMSQSLPRSLVE
jgi:hypothetical protein